MDDSTNGIATAKMKILVHRPLHVLADEMSYIERNRDRAKMLDAEKQIARVCSMERWSSIKDVQVAAKSCKDIDNT